jgi:hypothetical protein
MAEITKCTGCYMAEITVNGIYFNELGASPIQAFIRLSEAVEFEFGQIISFGMHHAN